MIAVVASSPPTAPATSKRARVRLSRQQSRDRIVAAATELVRHRSYQELSIGEVMETAGLGRTLFYRHFDDLADLLVRASREAIEELLEAQQALGQTRTGDDPHLVRRAIEPAVAVYQRHGPLLRAMAEAAASDEQVVLGYADMRRRFDALVADALREMADVLGVPPADPLETARALNLLNEAYLLDAFGREPRVSVKTAVQTLTEIWAALIYRGEDTD
jgi:AcrR family transcriptional regulator